MKALVTLIFVLSACGVQPTFEAPVASSEPSPSASAASEKEEKKASEKSNTAATTKKIEVSTSSNDVKTKEVIGIDESEGITGIIILLTGSKLPACEVSNVGQTYYIEENKEFQTCSSAGEWTVVDLRGAAGAKGEKGEQGVAGVNGLKGDKGDKGDTGANGTQGTQGIQGTAGAQGVQGTAGTNGVNGTNGTNGSNGTNGAVGQGAAILYKTSNNTVIGTSLGGSTVVFKGGGLADLYLDTGAFVGSYGYIAGQAAVAHCTFTSTDCSGTCYVNNLSSPITGTMKNTVFFKGSSWVKATGAETTVGSLTIRSRYSNGSCNNAFGSIVMSDNFPVTTGWTLPNSLTMPIGASYIDEVQ